MKFALPVFGIKAKQFIDRGDQFTQFALPVFGIKAKLAEASPVAGSSLLYPFLESRQSHQHQ